MAWTQPKTWVVGEVLTAADLNTHVRDNLLFLHDPPQCGLRADSVSIPHAASGFTAVSFAGAQKDSAGMFTVALPTRITITVAGAYMVFGWVQWASNATGRRLLQLARSGGLGLQTQENNLAASDPTFQNLATGPHPCAAGDYWEIRLHQNSGAALTATTVLFGVIRTGA